MPDYGLFGAEHVRQYEATGGKVGHDWNGAPVLVLQTTGRRSGDIRKFPLIYGRDGSDYVIVASKGGAAEHPGWYRNLVAHPDVKIQVRDKVLPARARTGTAEDKKRVWPTMTGAMARVRQVPGRDQARHSDRAAQPPLKPDERQLEDSWLDPRELCPAGRARAPRRREPPEPRCHLGGGGIKRAAGHPEFAECFTYRIWRVGGDDRPQCAWRERGIASA